MNLHRLTLLFIKDNQVDAAEDTSCRAINLSLDGPTLSQLYEYHHNLGHISHHRGDMEAAIDHHKTSLEISRSPNSQVNQAGILACLVGLLLEAEKFDDAQVHLEHLKLQAVNDPGHLGIAMVAQAVIWYRQKKLEEARSELSRTIGFYAKIGISPDYVGSLKEFLQEIEEEINRRAVSDS